MPPYEEVRKVLAAPYRNMSAEQIEYMMESYNVNAEEMENFLSTLGNIGSSVVGAIPQVLPGALPLVGTAVGGPLGGMMGGVAGQTLGSFLGPRQPVSAHSPPAAPIPPTHSPNAPLATQMPGGSSASVQLLQTIFQPQTLRAIISMLMGPAGCRSIPVGHTQVPPAAFTNLLSVLANQAAAESSASATRSFAGESVPRYFENYAGEPLGDPAIPEHRAMALLGLLQEAQTEPDEAERHDGLFREYSDETEFDEAFFDEMELAELYDEYEFV
jgi:hypothetical protein